MLAFSRLTFAANACRKLIRFAAWPEAERTAGDSSSDSALVANPTAAKTRSGNPTFLRALRNSPPQKKNEAPLANHAAGAGGGRRDSRGRTARANQNTLNCMHSKLGTSQHARLRRRLAPRRRNATWQ